MRMTPELSSPQHSTGPVNKKFSVKLLHSTAPGLIVDGKDQDVVLEQVFKSIVELSSSVRNQLDVLKRAMNYM